MDRLVKQTTILALVCCVMAGCGGRDLPIVPIDGTLTFGGSPPPKDGKIMFSPVEDPASDLLARPGYATFDTRGSFTVTTYAPGDGLIPGKYRVKVLCFRETPTLTNQDEVSFVPSDFSPEVVVPRDKGSLEVNLDVPATRLSTAARQ